MIQKQEFGQPGSPQMPSVFNPSLMNEKAAETTTAPQS